MLSDITDEKYNSHAVEFSDSSAVFEEFNSITWRVINWKHFARQGRARYDITILA